METARLVVQQYWRYLVDLSTFALCATLIGVYQVRLSRRIRRNPMHTVQGMNAQARVAWVERMIAENRDVAAVQTFRNSMMAASFMATTAVLLIFGILNLLANADKLGVAFHGLNSWGSQEPGMTVFKLMLIVVSFFVAFFAFALAVRGYHHAGYLINIPANGKRGVAPQKTVQVLNRASLYYMAGMRAYYFTVPLVLWMFGPVWLFVGTVALLLVLQYLDHLPD